MSDDNKNNQDPSINEDELKDIQDKIKELEDKESDMQSDDWVWSDDSKYDQLNEKYVRLVAEFDNYKKRSKEEWVRYLNIWAIWVLKAVIWFFDNFKRASEQCPEDIASSEWWKWIFAIEDGLVKELDKMWLKEIEAEWKPFDANKMEWLMQDPNTNKDVVSKVLESWYEFNWELVRPAKVMVGSKV